MEFEIKIKPLVLFDLEDKISIVEKQRTGAGKQFYEYFLTQLSLLQKHKEEHIPVYQAVREYVTTDASCKLFYTISDTTIFVMGLL